MNEKISFSPFFFFYVLFLPFFIIPQYVHIAQKIDNFLQKKDGFRLAKNKLAWNTPHNKIDKYRKHLPVGKARNEIRYEVW